MMTDIDHETMRRLTLTKLKIVMRSDMTDEAVAAMGLEVSSDKLAQHTVAEMKAYLASNTIHTQERKHFYPATWWDAFKEAHFPNWLKRRLGVWNTMITIHTEFIHVCPHISMRTSDEQRYHLEWLTPPMERTKERMG